ncbi:hypothetical protein BH09BAC2_BH09BAC2_16520 [soil metagenome]
MIKKRFPVAVAIIIVFVFSWSCTKIDTTTIGSGLIPTVDNVNTFELVLPVISKNYDSANIQCDSLLRHDEHPLGYIGNDPLFGKTTASLFLELKPPKFPYNFAVTNKDSLYLDSVVLVLNYTRTFGDSTLPQRVSVFSLNTGLFKSDSTYTTCNSFATNALLGATVFTPSRLKDTAKVFRDTTTNQLRIKLDNNFGNLILSQDSVTGAFKNDSIFKSKFGGFAIIPDQMGNALNYFDYDKPNTKLALYYRYSKNGKVDTTVNYFLFTAGSGQANKITRDHAGSKLASYQNKPAEGDSLIFIQTTPGTYATIEIPGLNNLSNRLVHRADLIMEQVFDPTNAFFAAPDILYLERSDTAGYKPISCDFIIANNSPNLSSFGGYKIQSTGLFGQPVNRYSFNVTRYIQNFLVFQKKDMKLKLSAPYHVINKTPYLDACNQFVSPFNFNLNFAAYGRIMLGGGTNTTYKMRLRIIYSKL